MDQITGLSKMRIIRQIAEQNLKEGPAESQLALYLNPVNHHLFL